MAARGPNERNALADRIEVIALDVEDEYALLWVSPRDTLDQADRFCNLVRDRGDHYIVASMT